MKKKESFVGLLCNILIKGMLALFLLVFTLPADAQNKPYTLRPLKGKSLEGVLTPTERRGMWGYADERGRTVIKTIFTDAKPFEDTLARVKFGDKWGVLRRNAEYLFEPSYDTIAPFVGDLAWMAREGKWGIVSKTGKELFAPQFHAPATFDKGLAWIERRSVGDLSPRVARLSLTLNSMTIPSLRMAFAGLNGAVAGVP